MHRTVLSILMLTCVLALTPACGPEPYTCGIYVYDPELDTCVCPPGSPPLADGTCGDAGPTRPDAAIDGCAARRFHRDGDEDGAGDPTDFLDACERPTGYVDNDDDCNDACETCHPGGIEMCEGALDEDCTNGVDDGCSCTVGATRACPGGTDAGECTTGTQTCTSAGGWSSCVGAVAPASEACNGLDDDCDTITDGPAAALACGTAPRATTVGCTSGNCIISACATGYGNCDTTLPTGFTNGCETVLGTLENCGSCGDECGWDCEPGGCNDAVSVRGGSAYTCVLRDAGDVVCWGRNSEGQLGNGTVSDHVLFALPVSGLPGPATQIAAGSEHACARTSSGAVWCWGRNENGELGDGTTTRRPTPVPVSGLSSGVAAIVAGGHSCALTSSGGARCWGRNAQGQLGDGTTLSRSTPVGVSGLATGVAALTAGGSHTCALLTSGSVRCWGLNTEGQLGDGTTTNRSAPVDVMGLSDVVAITAGDTFTCGLLESGLVRCWGANGFGQLGDGSAYGDESSTPVAVPGLAGVEAITAGGSHACALAAGGLHCWGNDTTGQVGDGGPVLGPWPEVRPVVRVADLATGVAVVEAGGAHSCVILVTGAVRCWGGNLYAQVGDGTFEHRTAPVSVAAP